MFLISGGMAVAGVFLLVVAADPKHGPGPLFSALWFLALLWNAYWVLFRVSYRIEMEENQIRWFTPLRRGQFSLDELVSIGSPSILYSLAIFKRTSGPSVITLVQRGLPEFAAEVHQRAPEVMVKAGIYERFLGMSWWNGFQRGK